jgi:hypothetical protein
VGNKGFWICSHFRAVEDDAIDPSYDSMVGRCWGKTC